MFKCLGVQGSGVQVFRVRVGMKVVLDETVIG